MDMIIDFPGGAKVSAHFGSFTVSTDQPRRLAARVWRQPPLKYSSLPLEHAPDFTSRAFAGNAAFQRMASISFNAAFLTT